MASSLRASRLRRNVIARVMEFPRWVDYMPNPADVASGYQVLYRGSLEITGLDKTLSRAAVETQQGRNNRTQYEAGLVTEALSSVTFTTPDKLGKVYQNMLWAWLQFTVFAIPRLVTQAWRNQPERFPDHLPDVQHDRAVHIGAPDAYQRKPQNAWWLAEHDSGNRRPGYPVSVKPTPVRRLTNCQSPLPPSNGQVGVRCRLLRKSWTV
ncbi:hypothetical protein N5V81_12730 [Escherichia coli]|nr:hypothetical protein [Escherichia coli]